MGIRFVISGVMAYYVGRSITKFKLPAILGWLITGMIFGPYALNILNIDVLNLRGYRVLISFFESGVGILIGSELVISELRKTGKQILVTTLFQSIGHL